MITYYATAPHGYTFGSFVRDWAPELADRVRVVRCEPDCRAADAWAFLEPFGALRLSALRPEPRPPELAAIGPDATFRYARVVASSVVSRRVWPVSRSSS